MHKIQKKQLLLVLVLVWSLSFSVQSQEMPIDPLNGKKNVLKLNLISPMANTLSLSYERSLGKSETFHLTFNYYGDSFTFDNEINYGFGIIPELRFYLSEKKNAPAGFFAGPYLSYNNVNLQVYSSSVEISSQGSYSYISREYTTTINRIAVGVNIGAQWTFKKRVTLDVFGGPNYGALIGAGKETRQDAYFPFGKAFGLRMGVSLGFAF